jgi:FixJ family two-component response regulator
VPLYLSGVEILGPTLAPSCSSLEMFMLTAPTVVAIIDDDPSMLDAMDNLLSSMGYQTERYASAEEFVDTAMKSKAAGLIVDMQLGGMSGLELGYQLSEMGLPF